MLLSLKPTSTAAHLPHLWLSARLEEVPTCPGDESHIRLRVVSNRLCYPGYTAWVRDCLSVPCLLRPPRYPTPRLLVVPRQLSGRLGPGVGTDTLPAFLSAHRLPSMPGVITHKRSRTPWGTHTDTDTDTHTHTTPDYMHAYKHPQANICAQTHTHKHRHTHTHTHGCTDMYVYRVNTHTHTTRYSR